MCIKEIYRLNYMRNTFSYIGTLRNEKKFSINDNVFFVVNSNEIAKGRIVGVELPPVENSDYIYKISLPEDLVRQKMKNADFYEGNNFDKITLKCDKIFHSVSEARDSAIKQLEKMFSLQADEIEYYFNQFKELQE